MALTAGWRVAGISFIERYFRTVEDWGFSLVQGDTVNLNFHWLSLGVIPWGFIK